MLFKILHGDASRISMDATPFHEGYCYVTYDGCMYIDMNLGTADEPNNQRIKLNAKDAESVSGAKLSTVLNESDIEIPTSKAVMEAIAGVSSDAVVEKNAGEYVTFWVGTKAEKDAIEEKDPYCLYIVTDEFDATTEKLDVPMATTVTLSANSWNGARSQVVAVDGIKANMTKQVVNVMPYFEASNIELINQHGVMCVNQGENALTFQCGTLPSVDVRFFVTWYDVRYVVNGEVTEEVIASEEGVGF